MGKMDQLLQEIKALEDQERIFEQNLVNSTEESQKVAFEQELNIVRGKLDSKRSELEQSKQSVVDAAQEIASSMETFRVGDTDFPLDQLAADDNALLILRAGIAEKSQQQAQKWLADLNTQKSEYEAKIFALTTQRDQLQQSFDEAEETNAQLHLDNEDLSEKRDAAVRTAEESKEESARLAKRVAELEKQLASAPTNAEIVEITSTDQLAAAAQRLKAKKEEEDKARKEAEEAAKIRVYNVHQIDGTGSKFGAYRADNDEYITFGWLEKAKYIELTSEQVLQFRESIEEVNKASAETVASADPVTAPNLNQFPGEPVQEYVLHGTVASAEDRPNEPIEEVVAKLTKRVERLEIQAGIGV